MKRTLLATITSSIPGDGTAQDLLWSYGPMGAKISGAVAAVGTLLTRAMGGWDAPLKGLCAFMVLDFALGILCAIKAGNLDSRIMFWGGVNKLLVLAFVAVGVVLDAILGLPDPWCRTAVVFFYIGREGLSLVENYGKLGGRLPSFLSKILQQLQDTADQGKEKEHV